MSSSVASSIKVTSTPPSGIGFPTGTHSFAYSPTDRTYQKTDSDTYDFSAGVTDQEIVPSGMQVKQAYLRFYGGSADVKITTSRGTEQIIPCDDVMVLGSITYPITSIKITTSTAQVEKFLVGDNS